MNAATVRLHIFCEGQTEETFVREVLQEHFNRFGVYVNPIVIRTSKSGRGGVTTYAKIRWQIEKKCKEDAQSWVSTLIDLYGSPRDLPGKVETETIVDPLQKVLQIEQAFEQNIKQANFIANLFLHEYEALLFSNTSCFADWFDTQAVAGLVMERAGFDTPEHINNQPNTAPSKRILRHCRAYNKPLHGSLIAMGIGLDTIRDSCQHFDSWVSRIERLAD